MHVVLTTITAVTLHDYGECHHGFVLPSMAVSHRAIAGDALAAYNILRAFSWQIRLSPIAFEELCAALFNPNPSPLMDELHVRFLQCTKDGGMTHLVLDGLTESFELLSAMLQAG